MYIFSILHKLLQYRRYRLLEPHPYTFSLFPGGSPLRRTLHDTHSLFREFRTYFGFVGDLYIAYTAIFADGKLQYRRLAQTVVHISRAIHGIYHVTYIEVVPDK